MIEEGKQLYCTNCGEKTAPGARFCASCGALLERTDQGKGLSAKPQKLIALGAVALVVVIVLAIVIGSNVGAGPERTVRAFIAAIEQGDVDKLTNMVDPSFFDELELLGYSRSQWEEGMAGELNRASGNWEERGMDYSIIDSTKSGDSAEVTVRMSDFEGDSEDLTFILVRRKGKWYIEAQFFGRLW